MNRNCVPIISSRYLLRTFAVPTKYQLNYMFGFRFKAKPEHVAAKVRRWYGAGAGMIRRWYGDGMRMAGGDGRGNLRAALQNRAAVLQILPLQSALRGIAIDHHLCPCGHKRKWHRGG